MPRASQFTGYSKARAPAHPLVAWLSVGVVALIAYGSLYPFDFKSGASAHDLWHALLQLSWARAGRSDRISNVLLYVPLGFCLFLSLDGRVRRLAAIAIAVLVSATLSFGIEIAQVFVSSRVPSLWDVTLNTCGAAGGVVGGIAWRALSGRLSSADVSGRGDIGALVALTFWLAWRWAPFALQVDLARLKAALQPLIHPQFDAGQCVHDLLWWVIVAQLVFAMVDRARGTESLLTLIAMTLVGRLFLADPAVSASELLALLLLLPTLVALHKLQITLRQWLLLAAFVALFSWDGLAPALLSGESIGERGSSGQFDLWPFFAWFDADMPVDLPWLFRKLFVFAALAWLLRNVGVSARAVVYLVTGAALLIECLQLWVPNRASSLTDPALALALTASLRLLVERSRSSAIRPRARNH